MSFFKRIFDSFLMAGPRVRDEEPAISSWEITLGLVIFFPLAYAVGYLGIDVLDWVSLPAESLHGDAIHASRLLIGMMSLFLLWVPFMLLMHVVGYDECP
jgi:hypothetical protein